ncbi:MAG TPA: hypothetical protein VFB29_12820 [Pseudolabrys sp.]|nr:hypothetical protein [Pseudolabrys sp.]
MTWVSKVVALAALPDLAAGNGPMVAESRTEIRSTAIGYCSMRGRKPAGTPAPVAGTVVQAS